MMYHYRANTYDSSALYVRNRIYQRPRDISLVISHLLADKEWGPRIDPAQIGVAGHSQGGFTCSLDRRSRGQSGSCFSPTSEAGKTT